jgi:hypothetical protein
MRFELRESMSGDGEVWSHWCTVGYFNSFEEAIEEQSRLERELADDMQNTRYYTTYAKYEVEFILPCGKEVIL